MGTAPRVVVILYRKTSQVLHRLYCVAYRLICDTYRLIFSMIIDSPRLVDTQRRGKAD